MAMKAYCGAKMYFVDGDVLIFTAQRFDVISDTEFIAHEVPAVMKNMVDKPYVFIEPDDVRMIDQG